MVLQVLFFFGALGQQGNDLHADLIVQGIACVGPHGYCHDQSAGDPQLFAHGDCEEQHTNGADDDAERDGPQALY